MGVNKEPERVKLQVVPYVPEKPDNFFTSIELYLLLISFNGISN
jgi:hypothetical protein